MGAHIEDGWALGRTPNTAYSEAVERALYERGHDPYNGTISTTSGFVDVSHLKPSRMDDDVFMALIYEIEQSYDGLPQNIREGGWVGTTRYDAEQRKWVESRRKLVGMDQRSLDLLKREVDRSLNKWENVVMFQVTNKAKAAQYKKNRGRKGTHDKVYRYVGIFAT